MAKTREDFVNEGKTAARSNNTRGAMPEFGLGASWQAKAFAEGFSNENTKMCLDAHQGKETAELAALKKTEFVKTSGRPIPRAVIEHINMLSRYIATGSDGKRIGRFLAKRRALTIKWERRCLAGA